MILTVKQIENLYKFVGGPKIDEESMETEIQIFKSNDKLFATFQEYPEEGSVEL